MNQLTPPESLNFEAKSLVSNWRQWRNQFELYAELALANKDNATKVKTLLYVIGVRGREIYETLNVTVPQGETHTPKLVLDAFKAYCIPTKNVTVERYRFFSRSQVSTETIDEYCTALRTLAKSCEFGAIQDSFIKDRIVSGISKNDTREKLLREQNLTLDTCLSICRAAELSDLAINEMAQDGVNNQTINAVRKRTPSHQYAKPVRKCKFCNKKHEMKTEKQENYFAVVYTTLNKPYKPRSLKKKFKRQVKMVDQNGEDSEGSDESSCSDEYTYVHVINKESFQNKLLAKLSLHDYLVKFQIDSGATCNIVPINVLSSDQANKIDTSKSTVLHIYNGATESTLGELAVKLKNPKTGNKYKLMCSLMDDFHKKVVPISGYSATQAMDIIHVNHENICRVESNASHPLTKQDILSEFVDVFEG